MDGELILGEVLDLVSLVGRIQLDKIGVDLNALRPGVLECCHPRANLRCGVIVSTNFSKIVESTSDGVKQRLLLVEQLTHFELLKLSVSSSRHSIRLEGPKFVSYWSDRPIPLLEGAVFVPLFVSLASKTERVAAPLKREEETGSTPSRECERDR